jgi:cytochrome c oxidase subunit II
MNRFIQRLLHLLILSLPLFLYVWMPGVLSSDTNTIEIICQKSHYSPETIRLRKGEPVRLILKSVDVTHGFAIDDLRIAREISPGPPTIVDFTPERSGTFPFYCVVRCGKEHLKMRGTLIVE